MTPSFPVEVWRNIFRLATSISSRLETLSDVHILDGDALKRELRSLFSSSVATKLTLSFVCKAWNAVAAELIYEHIGLSSDQHLSALKNALTKQAGSHAESRGYGWWTKSLDIPAPTTPDSLHFLIDLLPLFPNLSTLVIRGAISLKYDDESIAENFDHLAKALHKRTPKLSYLQCYQWDMKRGITGSVFIEHIPSLRTLRTGWGKFVPELSPPHFRHQKITSLSLLIDDGGDLPLHDCSTLPSLTHLYLNGSSLYLSGIVQFVRAHGKQLLVLGLCQNDDYPGAGTSLVEQHIRACPNLRELLLGIWDEGSSTCPPMQLSESVYPSVECLGVPAASQILRKGDWETKYSLNRFPNLKRIRLVDVLGQRSMGTGGVLGDYVVEFPPGIVFEDALGNVMDH